MRHVTNWRIDARHTASLKAKAYIRKCGSCCTVRSTSPNQAIRLIARWSGCPVAEFVVIGCA